MAAKKIVLPKPPQPSIALQAMDRLTRDQWKARQVDVNAQWRNRGRVAAGKPAIPGELGPRTREILTGIHTKTRPK